MDGWRPQNGLHRPLGLGEMRRVWPSRFSELGSPRGIRHRTAAGPPLVFHCTAGTQPGGRVPAGRSRSSRTILTVCAYDLPVGYSLNPIRKPFPERITFTSTAGNSVCIPGDNAPRWRDEFSGVSGPSGAAVATRCGHPRDGAGGPASSLGLHCALVHPGGDRRADGRGVDAWGLPAQPR